MEYKQNLENRTNCINLIRLIAALQVASGHMIAHLEIEVPNSINIILGYFQGVPIFFVLSGFLIWDSIDRSPSYLSYLQKRFWRIYPELWFGIIIEILAIVILYGIQDIKQFIVFIGTQATIFQFWTPESLRGYGCGTPNGSLWTIGILIQFYIIIWFLRKRLHGSSWKTWTMVFIFSIILGMLPRFLSEYLPEILRKLYSQTVFNYLYLFLLGAFFAERRTKLLPLAKRYWYIFLGIGVLVYITEFDCVWTSYAVIKALCCGYGLIGFAYAFPKFNIKKDVSYGLYIYHMTVVNVMLCWGLTSNLFYLIVALVLSILLAWISTKTVGEWAAKQKVENISNANLC